MSLWMYQLAPSGIRWNICANLSGVETLPSTTRSPVTITRMPPLGDGCGSHVVILWTTVWNWSVCGGREREKEKGYCEQRAITAQQQHF